METKKNYTLTTSNGQATLTLKVAKGQKPRSAVCEYPLYERVFNEQTNKYEVKRLRKSQVEKYLLSMLGLKA